MSVFTNENEDNIPEPHIHFIGEENDMLNSILITREEIMDVIKKNACVQVPRTRQIYAKGH